MLKWPQAGDVLDRLDADAHLVTVISAGVRQSMDGRADNPTQDQPSRAIDSARTTSGSLLFETPMPNKPKGPYRTDLCESAKPTR